MPPIARIACPDLVSWRAWLAANHGRKESICLEFYKDDTAGVAYREALEEALCWGWIDSLIKRIDKRVYVRKFSPRSPKSVWSELNKKLVGELRDAGRMKPAGLAKIEAAKKNGQWQGAEKPSNDALAKLVTDLERIIAADAELASLYAGKAPRARQLLARYYFAAKGEDTRKRRLERMRAFLRGEIAML